MQLPSTNLYPESVEAGVPIVTGAAGLTGRPAVRPVLEPDEYDPERDPPSASGPAIPPPCLRFLYSPHPECPTDCPGRQRDGGCLAEVVGRANAAGEVWAFEIDKDGYWERV